MRVLLVEDDSRVAGFLAKGLREQTFTVDIARDGEEGLHLGLGNEYDLVILDIMLPLKDGHAVCREFRAQGRRMPILMLTARSTVDDRLAGLDSGADDYLVKPFSFQELLARLRFLLRRSALLQAEHLHVADLTLDTASHSAARGGRMLDLTTREYALLELLVLNQDRTVNREQISQYVWDETFDPFSNTIDHCIKRLRVKLTANSERPLIHRRSSGGYQLSARQPISDD